MIRKARINNLNECPSFIHLEKELYKNISVSASSGHSIWGNAHHIKRPIKIKNDLNNTPVFRLVCTVVQKTKPHIKEAIDT
jgi:hypothetical protein